MFSNTKNFLKMDYKKAVQRQETTRNNSSMHWPLQVLESVYNVNNEERFSRV